MPARITANTGECIPDLAVAGTSSPLDIAVFLPIFNQNVYELERSGHTHHMPQYRLGLTDCSTCFARKLSLKAERCRGEEPQSDTGATSHIYVMSVGINSGVIIVSDTYSYLVRAIWKTEGVPAEGV